jgi:hypothetical protein
MNLIVSYTYKETFIILRETFVEEYVAFFFFFRFNYYCLENQNYFYYTS